MFANKIATYFLFIGLFLATVGVLFKPVHAQTWIGGHVAQNTVWTVVESPYRVMDHIVVDPGVLLTIEPGVEVQFIDGLSLTVQGSLNASGTQANPIIFTSSRVVEDPPNPYPGAWDTIKYEGNSSGQFTLKHSKVEYAVHGITIQSLGSVTVENNHLHNCLEDGIYIVGREWWLEQINHSLLIKENKIEENKNGIATDTAETHSGIIIVSNTIVSNHEDGIYLRARARLSVSHGTPHIFDVIFSSNTISNNGGHGICLDTGGPGYDVIRHIHAVTFSSNTISNNGGHGIYLASSGHDGGSIYNVTFSSNTISNNGGHGVNLQSGGLFGGSINDVTVSFNTVFNNGGGLCLNVRYVGSIYNVTVSSNTVLHNGGDGLVLGEDTDVSGDYIYNVTVSSNTLSSNGGNGVHAFGYFHHEPVTFDLTIRNNTISENHQKGVWIHHGINANLSRNSISYNLYGVFYTETQNNLLTHNDVYDNSYGVHVNGGANVNAEYNYWGHSTGPYHESLNFEGEGNPANGNGTDLDFIPFLTSPVGMINLRPTATLDVDKTNPNVGETVTFDASASTDDGNIDYFFIDFGDGTNSCTTLSVVTHEYVSKGTYNATLLAMDDFGVTSLDGDLVYVEITVVPEFPASLTLLFFMILTLIAAIALNRRAQH
jgi:parallel beta-helix repeat protein